MHTWFECKIRYEKTGEDGKIKKVTEPYLVDALSFTEAEARISKEIEPYISGEYTVSNIKRAKITELIPNDSGDRWYNCKINIVLLDESRGVEKKVSNNMLVQASDVKEAWDNLQTAMKGTMADFTVVSISESPLVDYFPYVSSEDKELEALQ